MIGFPGSQAPQDTIIADLKIKNKHAKSSSMTNDLSEELISEIFSYLNISSLSSVGSVCRSWNRVTQNPEMWLKAIQQIAFGYAKWDQFLGKTIVQNQNAHEESSSLLALIPQIIKDYRKFQRAFPKKRALDELRLLWIPQGLSLTVLSGALIHQNRKGFRMIWSKLTDTPVNTSYWMLITKNILPESQGAFYANQKKILKENLTDYEIPNVLEAATCLCIDSESSNTSPTKWTHCQEVCQSFPAVVWISPEDGLTAFHNYGAAEKSIGLLARRSYKVKLKTSGRI